MGDPTHFSVVGGANPHTRGRYGRKKTVDRELAKRQWARLREQLLEMGLRVEVIPPDPAHPGLVYPANAGFRSGDAFILSNLTPTRAGEQPAYRRAIQRLGLRCYTIKSRFEGEADLFPADDRCIFTFGGIERQRFVPRLGWPPWRRIYGFRSEPESLAEIEAIRPLGCNVLRIRLVDERYYHGDTCLCSFGPRREFLLAYPPVIEPASLATLGAAFGDQLIEISDADASIYAANSFAFVREGTPFLVMPEGITSSLQRAVRERGVEILSADVSEFHKKGGGSVKCMIGDLGELPEG